MTNPLLPSGLYDLLPPLAERESHIVHQLLSTFRQAGYAQVSPPIMEYENTLLADNAARLSTRSFRVMDPLSQQMMAVRADITMQIARIAGSLMSNEPRPLRLCYAGQTLRTTPDAMHSTRQFRQAGIELFGADSLETDVQVIHTAIKAVSSLQLKGLSIDLSHPVMFDTLCGTLTNDDKQTLMEAVLRKDIAAIEACGHPLIAQLAQIAAPAQAALKALTMLDLPDTARAQVNDLQAIYDMLCAQLGDAVSITIDPLEMRGFGYYTGVRFSLFYTDKQLEIGRGGRYHTHYGEAATGFTLYTEDLLPIVSF